MRVLGLLVLLVALAFVLVVGATAYLRPSGINYNVARNAAERAAGSAATHVRDVMKVPAAP